MTSLVILIHRYLYLISFEIVAGYIKLGSFQGTQIKISVLQEQPYITYPSKNSQYGIFRAKLQIQSEDHAEKLYFSGGDQFFQISPGITSLYDWGRKHVFIGRGGIICDQGGNFSKSTDRGSHQRASHRGTWTGCIYFLFSQ